MVISTDMSNNYRKSGLWKRGVVSEVEMAQRKEDRKQPMKIGDNKKVK